MTKLAAFALLLIGTAGIAGANAVPEIDPASGGSALALLTGALLVIRARRNQ